MTKTQAERLWLLGGGLVAFVLLLIGWFFFISPQRSQTDAVNGQISNAQLQNTTLQSRISSLRAQSKHLSAYQADLAAAESALPSTSGVPDFLRTLQSLGNSTLARVTSLTVGAPVAVAQGTASGAGTPSASPSPAASSSPASAATGTSGAATSPTTAGVYSLPITASVSGSTAALNNFLEQLQSVQPRAVLITHVTQGGSSAGGPVAGGAATGSGNSIQLVMSAFVAPSSVPASPSATPGR